MGTGKEVSGSHLLRTVREGVDPEDIAPGHTSCLVADGSDPIVGGTGDLNQV